VELLDTSGRQVAEHDIDHVVVDHVAVAVHQQVHVTVHLDVEGEFHDGCGGRSQRHLDAIEEDLMREEADADVMGAVVLLGN
jgi:hypothetical protein